MVGRGRVARRAPGARLEPDGGDMRGYQLQAAHERGHRQREQRRKAQRAQLALQRAADRVKPARSGPEVTPDSALLPLPAATEKTRLSNGKARLLVMTMTHYLQRAAAAARASRCSTLRCPHRSSHRSTNASSAASGPPPPAGPPFGSGWDPGRPCEPPLGMPAGGGAARRKKASAASGDPGPSSSRAKMPHPALHAQQATVSAASP